MLLQFKCANYRSIRDELTFHMTATNIKEHVSSNAFELLGYKVLKSSVIYGANASGKSNIIKAFKFMRDFVLRSQYPEKELGDNIKVDQFLLNSDFEEVPSFFETVFITNKIRYRYGFEVSKKEVTSEWLYYVPNKIETMLFERNGNEVKLNNTKFKEGKPLVENRKLLRKDALFLSAVAIWSGDISKTVSDWFKNININTNYQSMNPQTFADSLVNSDRKRSVLEYLKIADLGIEDVKSDFIELTPELLGDFPDQLKSLLLADGGQAFRISTYHKVFDKNNNVAGVREFLMDEHESDGTKKFAMFSNSVLDVLEKGGIWIVDELDARLHPLLTSFYVKLFHSNDTNPNNAQLIFATHDTNLLDKDIFRRDQIWFVEKDRFGCTSIASLVEYKKVRNDSSFEKDYISGKYGAIPLIRNLNKLREFLMLGEKVNATEEGRSNNKTD